MKTALPFAALLWTALLVAAEPAKKPAWDEIDRYREQQIEGWRVLVHQALHEPDRQALREDVLKLLDDHLYRVARAVPGEALAKLRKVPIWIELAHPRHPCMCYHPSAEWLRTNGMNPKKAGAVEIANCKTFLNWTHEQPWMVLHELAHAYHDQVLNYDHREIRECYERAKTAGIYDSVLHWDGTKVKAYALTNDKEYFAESSEAYFGRNDFYPFVRAELKQHDPGMYDLLEKVWGVKKD